MSTRRRNTILQALETFRRTTHSRVFFGFMIFLYVCENEGVTLSELAILADLPITTTSRIVKFMAGIAEGDETLAATLLEVVGSDQDQRLRFVNLSPAGRELRDRLEAMIAQASPILA